MEPENTSLFALVTGASHGLGEAIAIELAQRKINLILVALPNDGLQEVAATLAARGVKVHTYETDLIKMDNVLRLAGWVNENFSVHILVNNAGIGGSGKFEEAETEYLDGMIQLNVRAVVLLTRQLLPNLMRQKKAYVLNVSSIASFSSIGFKTVYPATKKFIQHFSEGLNEELKGAGVSITVVCPGPMATNETLKKRLEKQGRLGRWSVAPPQQVASVAVRKMFQSKRYFTVGLANHILRCLLTLLPTSWKVALATKTVRRELK